MSNQPMTVPRLGVSADAGARRWLNRVWWLQLLGGALYAAANVLWPDAAGWGQLTNAWYLAVAAPTIWVMLRITQSPTVPSALRASWRWLLAAMTVWFVGDLIWTAIAWWQQTPPALSVAEVAFLAFYPLALQSLASLPGSDANRVDRWRVQLDAFIASLTAAALFVWVWPVPAEYAGGSAWLLRLVHIANPVGDLMLLTALWVLHTRQTNRRSVALMRVLMVGLAAKALADTLHARSLFVDVDILNGLTGFLWLAFYAVGSFAASRRQQLDADTVAVVPAATRLHWLPYACVILVGGLLVNVVFAGDLTSARIMAVTTFVLSLTVLLRQWLVGLENRRLDRLAAAGMAESHLAALVRYAHDVFLVVDADGTIRYASPSVEQVLGMPAEQLQGQTGFGLVHPDDLDETRHTLARVLDNPNHSESRVTRVQHGHGGWRHLEMVATNRMDTASISGIVLNLRDVTERRELEGRLEWQAFHDPMTGLANRVLFADRVGHALARRQRSGSDIGVLFLDLDHFKLVNDTLGHPAGDALLREAAKRITQEVRAADTVARLGGDEFAILLEDAPHSQCQATAERLLAQLTRAYFIEGRDVFAGASIGLAMAQPGISLDDLVRDADVAMYVAKSEGRGRVVSFERQMRDQVTDRMTLEADLRRALERQELTVVYQPQVDLRTGEILGAEALVRWNHPTRGLIPPSRFVPIAEQAGLMVALSRFVLRTATRDASQWRHIDCDYPSVHVAVNLSGRHVQDPSLLDDVREALDDAGLEPQLLTIEITESVMMHNTKTAIAVLRDLKSLGCMVAVDDFGTGYSSLSYLQQFPVDVLKIDKRFIDTLGTPEGDDALTRAILSLGDSLGLATVAEGIETPRQLAELQRMGCLLGQGFLLAHPLPSRVFAELLLSGSVQQAFEVNGVAAGARGPLVA